MIRALIDRLVAPSVERLVKQVPTCEHKWSQLTQYAQGNILNDATNNVIWVLRCEKCGDIQTRKLR